MKKLILFFIGLCALSSCNVSDDVQLPESGKETRLTILLAASGSPAMGANTRTTVATESEQKLSAVDVLVFNREGYLLKKERFTGADITSSSGMVMKINVGVCNLFVLANMPDGMLDHVATTTDLSRVKVTLASQFDLTDGMVMSGEARNQQILLNDENRCRISLKRVTAKVSLNWNVNLPKPLDNNDLKVKRVFVLNNYANTTLTSVANNELIVTDCVHGKEDLTQTPSQNWTYAPFLMQEVNNTNSASFYLLENRNPTGDINTSAYSGTKIVIETLYSANGQETVYYYPIIINKLTEEAMISPIERNTSYQIKANIKGLSGVLDPFAPVVNRDLEITVEVVDWVSIDQSIDFN